MLDGLALDPPLIHLTAGPTTYPTQRGTHHLSNSAWDPQLYPRQRHQFTRRDTDPALRPCRCHCFPFHPAFPNLALLRRQSAAPPAVERCLAPLPPRTQHGRGMVQCAPQHGGGGGRTSPDLRGDGGDRVKVNRHTVPAYRNRHTDCSRVASPRSRWCGGARRS